MRPPSRRNCQFWKLRSKHLVKGGKIGCSRAKEKFCSEGRIGGSRTILSPAITQGGSSFELSKDDFRKLETEGGVSFNSAGRKAVQNIAQAWVDHDLILRVPRPGEFRRHLSKAGRHIEQAHALLNLTRKNASAFDRQLLMWILNRGGLPDEFFFRVGELQSTAALITRLEADLLDEGAKRPFDDQRYIIWLADVFERAGGRPRAYRSAHSECGYADTPFRRFVQAFYRLLPLKSERSSNGLDEAIKKAMQRRRRQRVKKG